jgi:hypothetical protein
MRNVVMVLLAIIPAEGISKITGPIVRTITITPLKSW